MRCPWCKGFGDSGDTVCDLCNGTGKITRKHWMQVIRDIKEARRTD